MNIRSTYKQLAQKQVSSASLAFFRVLFGAMMLGATVRFWLKGWISEMYIMPQFYFPYEGLEWIRPLGDPGMYILFFALGLSALFIMLGFFYRVSAISFFLIFTYIELIDKSNYLNHYYFISLVSFLMIWLPANARFALDVLIKPAIKKFTIPAYTVWVIRLQLAIVYLFAGISKINYDWLIEAMPLRTWLPANAHLPVIGPYLDEVWMAYLFSWAGCIYDLFIVFFLLWAPTRIFAYMAVIIFHGLTAILFPIGMFPYVMIISTLIFFPAAFHEKIISKIEDFFKGISSPVIHPETTGVSYFHHSKQKTIIGLLSLFFLVQFALPFRYLLYPGNLFWHEQGYRFSWRVMLMEKAGYVTFHITDPATGRTGEAYPCDYLTPWQEKNMSTQPDMILQFAHFLQEEYNKQGIANAEIRAEAYVTLNGSGSRLFMDPEKNLAKIVDNRNSRDWVLPFEAPKKYLQARNQE